MQAALLVSTLPQSRRVYRNRPSPSVVSEAATTQADVVYLVGQDSGLHAELLAIAPALHITLIPVPVQTLLPTVSDEASASCIIVNGSLLALIGADAQSQLHCEFRPPVIVVGESHDVALAVTAMKAGALDFIVKPVDQWTLRSAIEAAFAQDRRRRKRAAELSKLRERLELLTPREKGVLPLVVGGLLNKQAASVLGISEVTLQIHRSQIMRKMQASSLADLVRMAVRLRIPHRSE